MKIERVVCANDTHEVVLCTGDRSEYLTLREDETCWRTSHSRADEAAAAMLEGPDHGYSFVGAPFRGDPFLVRRPKTSAVDRRDARIAELEAALAAERAVSDAQKARADAAESALEDEKRRHKITYNEEQTAKTALYAAESALQEGVEILAEQRRRHADDIVALNAAVAWKISAQRIANCAVSVVEYLQSLEPVKVEDDYAHDAAMVGVELVLAALKEMQS